MFSRAFYCLKLLIILSLVVVYSHDACGQYINQSTVPKGQLFLNLPNDTSDAMWPADVYKNFKAYELRSEAIRSSLKQDETWGLSSFLERQVPGYGFTPSSGTTPSLIRLLNNGYSSINYVSGMVKNVAKRSRPSQVFYNNRFELGNEDSFSYPSSHSCNTWGLAMLLTGTNPWKADTIISRGVAHGQSRVIGGVHWQSDVDDGRILSTACYARMMAEANFLNDLEMAKTEACTMLGKDTVPSMTQLLQDEDAQLELTRSLPTHYMMSDPVGGSDMLQFLNLRDQCSDAIIAAAQRQSNLETDNILLCFSDLLNDTITATSHPMSYQLIDSCLMMSRKVNNLMVGRFDRIRPFDHFNTSPLIDEDIDSLRCNSPYPSLHAAMGWTAALTLVMLRPDLQHNILKRGMEIGDNRVSVGTTWQSDVNMGRIVGCIAFGYATSSRDFVSLVRQAQSEFEMNQNRDSFTIEPQVKQASIKP